MLAAVFAATPVSSQILISGGTYSQNFDSLATSGTANSWTDNSTLPGWYASTNAGGGKLGGVSLYRADSGSSMAGALYSYGASASTERALGSIGSGTPGNFAYGVRFTNDTGSAQSNITVSYTGEQWRNGGNASQAAQKLTFFYQVGAVGVALTNSDAANAQTWTSFSALDFSSPTTNNVAQALDGNNPTNRTVFTNIVLAGVAVLPGQEFFLRWFDTNDSGNDHALAVDDLTVSFSSTNSPTTNAPSITTQPLSQTNNAGDNVTFTVVASGTAPLSYQWQSNNVVVPGATNSSFTLASVTTNLSGSSYFVTVTNIAGSTNSQTATLTVNPPAPTNALVQAKTLRIVSYNIDCEDIGNDGNLTNSTHSLPTVVQAIALHHLGTNAQPVDLMSCEELNTNTLSSSNTLFNFCAQLNLIYGAGTYTYDPTTDPNTGGGPDGIIYRTNSVQIVSARAIKTGQTVLLQSNGTYTSAHSPGGGVNGVTRAPMVYQIRPVGFGTNDDFYFYVSHARSTSDDSVGDARYAEAQEVRSDAKYNLPAGSHIIYGGDWNLFNGGYENAYKCLTGQTTSDGINWSDTSAIWANTNQTQGIDPTSKTAPPTTTTWTNAAVDNATYLYDDATDSGLTSRIDIQLPNALMFAAYNNQGGVQLAPDTADPYDVSNFPASQYPYAFEVFGNDGSTTRNSTATSASNHSLNDLASTTPNASTVYTDLQEAGTGSPTTFVGSDHYPIFGDYNIVTIVTTPVLSSLAAITNNQIQFTITGAAGNKYAIDATTNLSPANWIPILTNQSPFTFKDTNTMLQRFYRARFVQ